MRKIGIILRNKSIGFSFVELMIVLVILSIIGGIAYPNFSQYVKNKRQDEAKAMLLSVLDGQEQYRAINKTFITDLSKLKYETENGKIQSHSGKFLIEAQVCVGVLVALSDCIRLIARPITQGDPSWELSSIEGDIKEL
ncbi:MAG: prepilin-type N-terminal cleavage/methylation domain-containing protein [Pseudomonadota bacterium]